jgi:signal transduction histidine kinase
MLGQVDVALRRDRTSDEYHRTLESVHEQATRLRQIVEMLLFLTREEAESAPPQMECIELNDWLAEHLTSWQHPRNDDLLVETDRTFPLWISAHGGLLGQVIDNLLDNASKYSEPNSSITIRTRQIENEVSLIIEDRGYGISKDDLTRVLDPFFRSVDARQRGIGGIGLGLSIVQRIVSALGARLTIESSVGQGTLFTILFRFVEAGELHREHSRVLSSTEEKNETVISMDEITPPCISVRN